MKPHMANWLGHKFWPIRRIGPIVIKALRERGRDI